MRCDLTDLIGKPYALPCDPPNSYDCWAIVAEGRKRLGLSNPDYTKTAIRRSDIAKPAAVWKQLSVPTKGCIVRLGALSTHCGMYLGKGLVLHTEHRIGVCVMTLDQVAQLYTGCADFWEMRDAIPDTA